MSQHKLEKGFELHRQGDLAEAKIVYAAFLEENPLHFDALHLSGLLSYEMGDLAEAESRLVKAIGN